MSVCVQPWAMVGFSMHRESLCGVGKAVVLHLIMVNRKVGFEGRGRKQPRQVVPVLDI